MDAPTLTPDVPCQIVPRRNATSDELKALGLALADWSERELAAGGLLTAIDNIVLVELLGGDDPAGVVFALVYGESDDDYLTITRRTPSHADPAEAAQRLVVACSFRGTDYDRRRAVESLRAALPAELVEDVVIDGRSWELA